MPGRARRAVAWTKDQIEGWIGAVVGVVRGVSLRDLLPAPAIRTLKFIFDSVPKGLGFTDGPGAHIVNVGVLTVAMIVASLGTLTIVGVIFFVVMLPIALLRLWPAVESRWPLSRSDWPFWNVV